MREVRLSPTRRDPKLIVYPLGFVLGDLPAKTLFGELHSSLCERICGLNGTAIIVAISRVIYRTTLVERGNCEVDSGARSSSLAAFGEPFERTRFEVNCRAF